MDNLDSSKIGMFLPIMDKKRRYEKKKTADEVVREIDMLVRRYGLQRKDGESMQEYMARYYKFVRGE